jgi:hypothetical protein
VQTLTEHWDGTSWVIVSSPNASGAPFNVLKGVTCLSSSNCTVVGFSYSGTERTLIEHWNGSFWTVTASPNTSPTDDNELLSVACTLASDCWAVGYFASNTTAQTLIEHWDGTSWAIIASPNMTGAQLNILNSVTCSEATNCWTVGYYGITTGLTNPYQALIEHWNGISWSIAHPTNLLPPSSALFSVNCGSASDCWAVGLTQTQPPTGLPFYATLVEHWNGILWTVASSPNTAPMQDNGLLGVSCLSASNCWAVGGYYSGLFEQTTVQHWDSVSWSLLTSPNRPPTETHNHLYDATCISASQCWAVGSYTGDNVLEQTLVERWDGNSWSVFPSANANVAGANLLYGVTCAATSDCWAVGYYFAGGAGGGQQTLIEHWDGTSWSVVSSPNVGIKQTNILFSVTCGSPSNCWAVGYALTSENFVQGAISQTLIEHWDGSSWTIAPSANTSTMQSNSLFSATCVSATECWAVGSYFLNMAHQTLIERWDGASWTIISSPNTDPTQANILFGVACPSASDCWAVGVYIVSSVRHTLTQHWDGSSWRTVPSPDASDPGSNTLSDVVCVSSSECFAIGNAAQQTLIERWDGNAWTVVKSENNNHNGSLSGITCASPGECWAVGYYGNPRLIAQTLVEKLAHPPSLLSIVSRKSHGNAGVFDVDLTNGSIECRSGGANGNYTLVFTFANPLTSVDAVTISSGTAGIKSGVIGTDAHQYIVDLTGVTNGQHVVVSLKSVQDAAANFSGTVAATFNLLIGDTSADQTVNSADIAQTKSQSGTMVTNSNCREDLNADGWINSGDIAQVKSKSGTALP